MSAVATLTYGLPTTHQQISSGLLAVATNPVFTGWLCPGWVLQLVVCLQLQLFCAGLTAAAGWCIFKGLCPAEVRSIEDCIGISNSAGRAPVIPARCADRAALLEACLESQQEVAERKTGQCGGAQPIPKAPKPAPAPAS